MNDVWDILEKEQFTELGIEHFEKVYGCLSKIFENVTSEDIDFIYDVLTDDDAEIVFDVMRGMALEKRGKSVRWDDKTDNKPENSEICTISMEQ